MQLTQVPWSAEAQYRLPIETWQRALAEHYPPGGYVRLGGETLEALRELRGRARPACRSTPCVADLCDGRGGGT